MAGTAASMASNSNMSFSGRNVLPPSVLPEGAERETLEVVQSKLQSAENNMQELVGQLTAMGFKYDDKASHKAAAGSGLHERIPPFLPPSPSPGPLPAGTDAQRRTYEQLVSRVCRTESALQTLKLNIMRLESDKQMLLASGDREKSGAEEKLGTVTQEFNKEIKKVQRELAISKQDCAVAEDKRKKLEENVRKLQQALEENSNYKGTSMIEMEEMKRLHKQQEKQMSLLKENLAREQQVRAGLEASQSSTAQRIRKMEEQTKEKDDEIQQLYAKTASLQRENSKAGSTMDANRTMIQQYEERIQKLYNDREKLRSNVERDEEEKRVLVAEIGKIKAQYTELNSQLDTMKTISEEKEATKTKLEKEVESLKDAMRKTATENAQMTAQCEAQTQKERSMSASQLQGEQLRSQLQEQLRTESRQRVQAEHDCQSLRNQVKDLEKKVSFHHNDAALREQQLQQQNTELQQKLSFLEADKEAALKDKMKFQDEVNGVVDAANEERSQLEAQLEQFRLELSTVKQSKTQLELHNKQLLDRMAAVEQKESNLGSIEKQLAEMMEQKNKLAYEKGMLHSKVEQLQDQMETIASMSSQLPAVQRKQAALEAQNTKLQSELSQKEQLVQRLEAQVRAVNSSCERKEKDFQLALQARDKTLKELEHTEQQYRELQERYRHQSDGLRVSSTGNREEQMRMGATLESVMTAHKNLEKTIEDLQTELGSRDTTIQMMHAEKAELEQSMGQLQAEHEGLHSQIEAMQRIGTTQVEPLRSTLHQVKTDYSKVSSSLDMLVKENGRLQAQVDMLQNRLDKEKHLQQKLKEARSQEESKHKQELHTFEERLTSMKEQLSKERDKNIKRTNKDVVEVRKQLEDIISKNGELSRTNQDLRHKMSEMEGQMKDQKSKISSHRHHIEHLSKIKKKQEDTINSLQAVSEQVAELERSKTEYMRKTKDQARTISALLTQVQGLQEEMKTLATTHLDTSTLLNKQEQQLSKERQQQQGWKRKYKECREREQHLESLRQQAETTLREADNESMFLSNNITDAHGWFKAKFESLQEELGRSKRSQVDCEQEARETRMLLQAEKDKAEKITQQAREMIMASRATIQRVGDQFELAKAATQREMEELKNQARQERENSRRLERSLKQTQEASIRHSESLAMELSKYKSQGSGSECSSIGIWDEL